jgi:hypothetical protein
MNNPYPEKLGITADSGRLFDVANPSYDAWNEAVISLIKWLEEPCVRHKHYNEYSAEDTFVPNVVICLRWIGIFFLHTIFPLIILMPVARFVGITEKK